MKQRIRNFCRTIRFKMLIILLAFLMVYVVTVSYFLYDTLQSTQSKILSPYQDMLDLYVEQLETSLEDLVRAQLALGRRDYLEAGETGLEQISADRLQSFREIMER